MHQGSDFDIPKVCYDMSPTSVSGQGFKGGVVDCFRDPRFAVNSCLPKTQEHLFLAAGLKHLIYFYSSLAKGLPLDFSISDRLFKLWKFKQENLR